MRTAAGATALLLALVSSPSRLCADDVPIPPENRPALRVPPERPSEQAAQEAARLLFEALVADDPARAEAAFFPREAFVRVKAMQRPERYYDRLKRRFASDIHALHRAHPELARAELVKLDLGRRGGWVQPGEEGNRLPYWAARHARLHYRVGSVVRQIEVRVLITWGDRWYVIHLSEFR